MTGKRSASRISGLLKPKAGLVTFGGKDITAATPHTKLGLGVVHVPQDRSLFSHMTVWDNLLMGGYSVRDHHAVRGRIEEATAMFPILDRRRHAHAGSLAAAGRTVLLVEQNARSGLAAAHVGAVLESGVVRLVRPAGALLADPDVARLYLGGHAAAAG